MKTKKAKKGKATTRSKTTKKEHKVLELKSTEEVVKFNNRYGNGSVDMFEKILWQSGKLSDVSSHFGFSRAYASMVYNKLFKGSFKQFKDKRRKILTPTPYVPYKSIQELV